MPPKPTEPVSQVCSAARGPQAGDASAPGGLCTEVRSCSGKGSSLDASGVSEQCPPPRPHLSSTLDTFEAPVSWSLPGAGSVP